MKKARCYSVSPRYIAYQFVRAYVTPNYDEPPIDRFFHNAWLPPTILSRDACFLFAETMLTSTAETLRER